MSAALQLGVKRGWNSERTLPHWSKACKIGYALGHTAHVSLVDAPLAILSFPKKFALYAGRKLIQGTVSVGHEIAKMGRKTAQGAVYTGQKVVYAATTLERYALLTGVRLLVMVNRGKDLSAFN